MSTELAVTKIVHAGITPGGATVDDAGNWFANTGRCFLHILGGTAGALAVTINSQALCNYGTDHDVVVTPVAATIYLVGPFPKSRFDDADGKVQIGIAAGGAVDLMKIQVIELP